MMSILCSRPSGSPCGERGAARGRTERHALLSLLRIPNQVPTGASLSETIHFAFATFLEEKASFLCIYSKVALSRSFLRQMIGIKKSRDTFSQNLHSVHHPFTLDNHINIWSSLTHLVEHPDVCCDVDDRFC